jgi:hypothetical protein
MASLIEVQYSQEKTTARNGIMMFGGSQKKDDSYCGTFLAGYKLSASPSLLI